jgi:TonB family protein
VYLPAYGQNIPEIENLATRTAGRVAKTNAKLVFIGARQGCIIDSQLCENLDSNLRNLLGAAASGIQFSSKEDVVSLLKNRGFLSIDAYQDSILRGIVSNLGVEILVVDDLIWKGASYELSSKIIDVKKDKELDTFTVKISRSAADNEEKPIFIRDVESGASLIVLRGSSTHFPPFKYPACTQCPDPQYTEAARHKGLQGTILFLITVSERGIAEQIALVRSFDSGLTASAFQAIQRWRFKPAIGLDGKPFAVRVPVEVTFRLAL